MRLQDWNISIKYVNWFEDDRVAECHHSINNFYAEIRVLEPEAINSWQPKFHNVELSVVHELVHLYHQDLPEAIVEKIAQALLEV